MKKSILVLLLFGCLTVLALPLSANAVLIDFDSYAGYTNIDGVNLGGVTITSPDGSTVVLTSPSGGVGYRSPSNAVTNNNFLVSNPMTFTFDYAVMNVSLTGGDVGGDHDQFMVTAYDSLNNMIGSITTPVFGGNPIDPLVMVDFYTVILPYTNIYSLVVSNPINYGIGIDDLSFDRANTVPEPSTFMLLGAGIVGAGLLRKKFRK
jgi:hypothetical protein